jgi:hypothetical protein
MGGQAMNKKYYKKPTIKIIVIRQMSMLCDSFTRGAKTIKSNDVSDGWVWGETLSENDDDC